MTRNLEEQRTVIFRFYSELQRLSMFDLGDYMSGRLPLEIFKLQSDMIANLLPLFMDAFNNVRCEIWREQRLHAIATGKLNPLHFRKITL